MMGICRAGSYRPRFGWRFGRWEPALRWLLFEDLMPRRKGAKRRSSDGAWLSGNPPHPDPLPQKLGRAWSGVESRTSEFSGERGPGIWLSTFAIIAVASVLFTWSSPVSAQDAQTEERLVIVVRGASGTDEYGELFDSWANRWVKAAKQGGGNLIAVGARNASASGKEDSGKSIGDFDLLKSTIDKWAHRKQQTGELWIVLIGHGTFDGRTARFNLQGRDVSAKEFEGWLKPVKNSVAFINCASSSAPFMKRLAGPGRVLVTATKSGSEQNFARFGEYMSLAIGNVKFDLDKDGQTSLFEAFLAASRRTEEFYETEGRLATEHALLDDNGDGNGVRADWFRGVRVVKKAASGAGVDWQKAHQMHLVPSEVEKKLPVEVRRERDRIEMQVISLRDRKSDFEKEDEYYAQLEDLLLSLAKIYEPVSAAATGGKSAR